MKIWLDDLRDPPDDSWQVARDYDQFVNLCWAAKQAHYPLDLVSFDHDLGEDSADGYSCIKILALPEFCEIYPLNIEVHSANPVGRENIIKYDEWYRRMRLEAFEAMDG
jgi:hypothetical protein